MKEVEVAVLLALANGHDQRHGTDDIKVQAWYALLEQEAPGMTLEWAKGRVNHHYARSTEMLMPAHLVTQWKRRRELEVSAYVLQSEPGVPMPEWFKELLR
jgi:hypothetical protein